jgi:hypothetical protein
MCGLLANGHLAAPKATGFAGACRSPVYQPGEDPMNIRTIAGATALTIALSSGAFAATMHHKMAPPVMKMPVAAECISLEKQFSAAVPHHKHGHWLAVARSYDAEGTKFCGEGKTIRGEFDLRRALRDLGVKA